MVSIRGIHTQYISTQCHTQGVSTVFHTHKGIHTQGLFNTRGIHIKGASMQNGKSTGKAYPHKLGIQASAQNRGIRDILEGHFSHG